MDVLELTADDELCQPGPIKVKPKAKYLVLRGPLERDIQPWILAMLGEERFEWFHDRNDLLTKRSLNTWVSHGGRCVWHRNNTGATKSGKQFLRYGLGKGGADIIGLVDGKAVALECKRPKEKQSAEQKSWALTWTDAGGIYAVVTCPREAQEVRDRVLNGEEP